MFRLSNMSSKILCFVHNILIGKFSNILEGMSAYFIMSKIQIEIWAVLFLDILQ